MFHTSILWKKSIVLQTTAGDILINPYKDHKLTQDYNNNHTLLAVVMTSHQLDEEDKQFWENYSNDNTISFFFLEENNATASIAEAIFHYYDNAHGSYLTITYKDTSILYDESITVVDNFPVSDYDTIYFDVSGDRYDVCLTLASMLQPRIGVAMNVDQENGIAFCRNLMLEQICVPKYLMPGQYIVHND